MGSFHQLLVILPLAFRASSTGWLKLSRVDFVRTFLLHSARKKGKTAQNRFSRAFSQPVEVALRSCRGNRSEIAAFLSSFSFFHEQHDKSISRDHGSLCLRLATTNILEILRWRSTSVFLKLSSSLEFLWVYLFSPRVKSNTFFPTTVYYDNLTISISLSDYDLLSIGKLLRFWLLLDLVDWLTSCVHS